MSDLFWLFEAQVERLRPFFPKSRRCCRTLTTEDSQRESMRLDGVDDQAITRPILHDELVQVHRVASPARVTVDLVGQGDDLACAA